MHTGRGERRRKVSKLGRNKRFHGTLTEAVKGINAQGVSATCIVASPPLDKFMAPWRCKSCGEPTGHRMPYCLDCCARVPQLIELLHIAVLQERNDTRRCWYSDGCECEAEEDERLCPFHMEVAERTLMFHTLNFSPRYSIPLTTQGKWDGYGSMTPKPRKKDERGERQDEFLSLLDSSPEKKPGFAKRRSRFADIVDAVIYSPKGKAIAMPPEGDDPTKFLVGLRTALRQDKRTMHGSWSVRMDGDRVFIRRIGSHNSLVESVR